MTSFDYDAQIERGTDPALQETPDPLKMLIPGFLQPTGPGGTGGRDRGVLGAVGSVFDSLIEYTPVGDLRDAYEVSSLVATPRSQLPPRMVTGTLGMLGAVAFGGKVNARVAAQIHADPNIPTTMRRQKTMTAMNPRSLSWDQQQMRLTPPGHRARLISGSPMMPHRAISVMADSHDSDIATMILEYGAPMVDSEMAMYDQYLTQQLGGRSIFDAPVPKKGPGSRSVPGDFAPTAPDEIFFGSERIAAASLHARLLQTAHPSALYATTVEELAEYASATDYQRARGRTVPVLSEEQTMQRSAILAAWIMEDKTGADDFMVEQAQAKATQANETQIYNAAKWASQKFRLAKMASAWNSQIVYGDFGPAFSYLWGKWATGDMKMGSSEQKAFTAALTEFGTLMDYFPSTDASLGWTPNGRILGIELNAEESSAVVFGEYGEPEFQRGGGTITAGFEGVPLRAQPPGTATGPGRRAPVVGESAVPQVLGSKLIPRVEYRLENTELIDPAFPELGSKWKVGAEHLTPSQITMSRFKATSMEAEIFGHMHTMFDEASNQTGGFTRFHKPYEDVQTAAKDKKSLTDSVIPSRRVDYEVGTILPRLTIQPGVVAPMTTDVAIDTTTHRFNTGKIQRVTVTIDEAGQLMVAPQDIPFVQAMSDPVAMERHGLAPPRVMQIEYSNLDHDNYDLVADALKGGQVHEIEGYPGRDLVAKESYRAVYPTLITWVAHHTNYSYLQLAQVFGMYGMQTDLNEVNIPAFILDALGWTSRVTSKTADGEKTTMMRPKAADEIAAIVKGLEAQQFTESADATKYLMTQMEEWYHRWHDAGSRFSRNNNQGTAEWREWYGEKPKKFAGMNATILDPGKAVFAMDADRLNQAADINGQFLESLDFADDLAALMSYAESTGKKQTKRWGASRDVEVEGPGLIAEAILGKGLEAGAPETKIALEEALASDEWFFQRKYLTYSISYDPVTQRWEMQHALDKAKLTAYFASVSPARIDEVMRAPDIVSIPFDPSVAITDVMRHDNMDVSLQDMIDVALALQTEQGVNLHRAIVADVHMAMIALGFSPGGLPLSSTSVKDPKTGKRKKVPNIKGGMRVVSPSPAHQAQFADTAAYRALGMGLLNLRMTKQGFEDAASLQSFLWYPWRILGGSSGSGFVFSPRVLHALRGQMSNPTNVEALRRVNPSTAQLRDFELDSEQMEGLSGVVRMTADGQTGTRYVPRELVDKNDAWWVIEDAEANVRVRDPVADDPERSTTRVFHPAIPRTGAMVTDARAQVMSATQVRTPRGATRQARRIRRANVQLVEDSYAFYRKYRQGALENEGYIETETFGTGRHGAWLRDWANGLGGVGYGTYNENALRALFMDPNAPLRIRQQMREHFLPGHVEEANPLRGHRGGAIARARRVAQDLTQRQLEAMGVPEEVIVWRQVLNPNDFTNGQERPGDVGGRFEGDAYKHAPISFSLVPPVTGYFPRAIPFKVKRADIKLSTMAVAQGLDLNDWFPYWQNENEVMIDWADVTELDPTEVLISGQGASSFGVTYDSTFHTDTYAQPGEGVRLVQLVVPRPANQASDIKARAMVDRIIATVSGRIVPQVEYAETVRPQWLLPTIDPGQVMGPVEGSPEVVAGTRLILQAAVAAKAEDVVAFRQHLKAIGRHFAEAGKLGVLTADDTATLAEYRERISEHETERAYEPLVEIEEERNTWGAVADVLHRMEEAGHAEWTTNPLAAELATFLGEVGVIPSQTATAPAMAINFPINSSVDTENLLKFLHSPLAEAFPEFGDISMSDAKAEVEKLQRRGVRGKELEKAKARLAQSEEAEHLVRDLPPATGWLPKKEDGGTHERGYRVMDVFGEVNPQWMVTSADPNDKVEYLVTALLGSGVHPDYQPEVAVEAMFNDGMRSGSVFMELGDTNHPHVRKVVMSRPYQRLLGGSANLHITSNLTVKSEGDTHIWGEGRATTEADVGQFAADTTLDKAPEGYRKTKTVIDGADRSLFGVRIYRVNDEGGDPILVRPSTMAIALPDPISGVKSIKQDRQVNNPALEEPLPIEKPLVVFDEDQYMDYFAKHGITDASRIVEVRLDWSNGEITDANIFVNDVATAAYAKQLLRDTGVTKMDIGWDMLDVDEAPEGLTAVA